MTKIKFVWSTRRDWLIRLNYAMNVKTSSIVSGDNARPFARQKQWLALDVLEFKKIVDTLIEKTEEYSKQVEIARLKVSDSRPTICAKQFVLGHRREEYAEICWEISRIRTATNPVTDQRENDRTRSVRKMSISICHLLRILSF